MCIVTNAQSYGQAQNRNRIGSNLREELSSSCLTKGLPLNSNTNQCLSLLSIDKPNRNDPSLLSLRKDVTEVPPFGVCATQG
jgi:hypothetical protein